MDTLPHSSGHPGFDIAHSDEATDTSVTGKKMMSTRRINASCMATEVQWLFPTAFQQTHCSLVFFLLLLRCAFASYINCARLLFIWKMMQCLCVRWIVLGRVVKISVNWSLWTGFFLLILIDLLFKAYTIQNSEWSLLRRKFLWILKLQNRLILDYLPLVGC